MIKYLQFKKSDLDKLRKAIRTIEDSNVITRINNNSQSELILRIENRVSDENVVYAFIDKLKSEI